MHIENAGFPAKHVDMLHVTNQIYAGNTHLNNCFTPPPIMYCKFISFFVKQYAVFVEFIVSLNVRASTVRRRGSENHFIAENQVAVTDVEEIRMATICSLLSFQYRLGINFYCKKIKTVNCLSCQVIVNGQDNISRHEQMLLRQINATTVCARSHVYLMYRSLYKQRAGKL